MILKKGVSLRGLVWKLIFSFSLTILGSWGLIITRMDITVLKFDELDDLMTKFYIDLVSLTLCFLGLFMIVYYYWLLSPRLKRVAELGEDHW
ncbi:MAG: hypothetical protein LBS31_02540 [Candidatus Adiutrix sp.]|jgi:uncharacterized BrkB/YihY/UPF0761 family membrane protein|nr:hypothetical protein [Candidatus Adiutrix sp.]